MTPHEPNSDSVATLSESTLILVDVETTGLSPRHGDRVCEIGIIRREPDGARREWSTLINPERQLSPGAFAVNGITPEMLDGAPRFGDIIDSLTDLVDGGIWVAHNAPFDLGFLEAEYTHAQSVLPELPVIDTAGMARRHFRFPSNRLGALAEQFSVTNPDAHRALGDCLTMEAVFLAMVGRVFGESDPVIAELTAPVARGHAPRRKTPWGELPESLAELLRKDRKLEIVYVSADGEETTRPIHVRAVVGSSPNVCLVAECGMRRATRHFRLERIIDWKPLSN